MTSFYRRDEAGFITIDGDDSMPLEQWRTECGALPVQVEKVTGWPHRFIEWRGNYGVGLNQRPAMRSSK